MTNHAFLNKGIADIQITNLEYSSDIKAHIFSSWYNPFKEHRLVVCGSSGFIDYKASEDDFFTIYDCNYESFESNLKVTKEKSQKIYFEKTEPLKEQFRYFIDNIINETTPEIAGPKSALETTEIMLSIKNQ